MIVAVVRVKENVEVKPMTQIFRGWSWCSPPLWIFLLMQNLVRLLTNRKENTSVSKIGLCRETYWQSLTDETISKKTSSELLKFSCSSVMKYIFFKVISPVHKAASWCFNHQIRRDGFGFLENSLLEIVFQHWVTSGQCRSFCSSSGISDWWCPQLVKVHKELYQWLQCLLLWGWQSVLVLSCRTDEERRKDRKL